MFAKWNWKELLYTCILWAVYLIIIAYRHDFRDMIAYANSNHFFNLPFKDVIERSYEHFHPILRWQDLAFTLNYFVFIFLINYILLPGFFYRKKYVVFVILSLLAMGGSIVVEEFVLEKIFYSNTAVADFFPGFFINSMQVGPVFLFFVGFKLAWDNLQKQSQLEQMEKEHVQSQLQFLKSQLNPHFLFNNLNNLYSYSQENSPKTQDIILQLSAILRYMLYESKENFVPLHKELTYLEDFIRLQELQMEDRGVVNFQVTGETGNQMIAPLILITFVENCFKHSLSSQTDDISIDIRANVEDHTLKFHCANTFSEVENTAQKYISNGIGLSNVKKRLDLLYPGKYDLGNHAKDNIYYVDLILKLTPRRKTESSRIPKSLSTEF